MKEKWYALVYGLILGLEIGMLMMAKYGYQFSRLESLQTISSPSFHRRSICDVPDIWAPTVEELQEYCRLQGHEEVVVDGIFSEVTKDALERIYCDQSAKRWE